MLTRLTRDSFSPPIWSVMFKEFLLRFRSRSSEVGVHCVARAERVSETFSSRMFPFGVGRSDDHRGSLSRGLGAPLKGSLSTAASRLRLAQPGRVAHLQAAMRQVLAKR
jgi:hypothetical protein